MAKFKNKNGGIAEVFTDVNIERLRRDKNYSEIIENAQPKEKKTPKKNKKAQEEDVIVQNEEEVVENEPLQ